MENIRQTLEPLGKPEGKTKYGGQCEEFNSVKIGHSFMTGILKKCNFVFGFDLY